MHARRFRHVSERDHRRYQANTQQSDFPRTPPHMEPHIDPTVKRQPHQPYSIPKSSSGRMHAAVSGVFLNAEVRHNLAKTKHVCNNTNGTPNILGSPEVPDPLHVSFVWAKNANP